jgi:hypothetical protein
MRLPEVHPRRATGSLPRAVTGPVADYEQMARSDGTAPTEASIPQRAAATVAARTALPTSVRAVLGYYSDTGDLALGSLELKRYVDQYVEDVIQSAFEPVEAAVAEEFDVPEDRVAFDYDTKLTMPAELTLSHLFGRVRAETEGQLNPLTGDRDTGLLGTASGLLGDDSGSGDTDIAEARDRLATIRDVTELVVVALIDGDMRDAINDEEYEDFAVGFPAAETDRARIAEIAQAELREQVAELFEQFPDAVEEQYTDAVELSEAHQDRDPYFRDLMARAERGEEDAVQAIAEEYKYGEFDDPPELFTDAELSLPYLKTQYGRVGVIYHGMIEMYRAAGIEIEPAFERSIVFAIIGAQIWLDDVDDYRADVRETQLTPVTAEYLLAEDAAALDSVVEITNQYLTAAKEYAAATDSGLAGIGADYILRSGSAETLPGRRD